MLRRRVFAAVLLGVATIGMGFWGCDLFTDTITPNPNHLLTVQAEGQGRVEPFGQEYSPGSTVTLTATAAEGWTFVQWAGDASGAATRVTVTMDSDKTVRAVFREGGPQYTLTITVYGQGTTDPAVGEHTYEEGTVVALTATPADGWTFTDWRGDLSETEATTQITMDANKTITALFEEEGVELDPTPQVRLETTLGDIIVELDREAAPITVANFLQYVEDGFYDGTDGNGATIFHRVIAEFMIQGGGYLDDMTAKETRAPIVNEAQNGLTNDRGTIAMARTGEPHSATSQFYINLRDNTALNYTEGISPGYAVFGRVIEGMDVVDAISVVETGTWAGFANVPIAPITITSATIITEEVVPASPSDE